MSLAGTLSDALQRPEVRHALYTGALVLARFAPLVFVAPTFGLRGAAAIVRSAIALSLTLALTPIALGSAHRLPFAMLPLAIVNELLLGTLFALTSAVPFYALEAGGRLIDVARGANLAEVIAPPTGEQTSALGDLSLLGGLALFATLGGLRLTLHTLGQSLVTLPVGSASPSASALLVAASALARALDFAAMVAAPAAIAILVVDIALGLLSRSVQRISTFFLGMPLRATVGLVFTWLSIALILNTGVEEASSALVRATRLLR